MFYETPVKGIYRIEVPLPKNPLKALNSYYIAPRSLSERGLLIDTGFDHPETFEALKASLYALNADMNQTDLLATHLHSDHCGLLHKLKTPSNQIFASQTDGDIIQKMATETYWNAFQKLYTQLDLDRYDIGYKEHPGYTYCPKETIHFTPIGEGDLLHYGGYEFQIISVPGHTPGQIVLFESQQKLLISADHILDQITPNISYWGEVHGDMLGKYLDSLTKVDALSLEMAFPSHRNLMMDPHRRISELKAHHDERLRECLAILRNKTTALSARAVASEMHWDVRAKSFEEFPSPQKWFATSEAMAHLVHLNVLGCVKREEIDHIDYFTFVQEMI